MNGRIPYSRTKVDEATLRLMCRADELVRQLNALPLSAQAQKEGVLRQLLGNVGERPFVGDGFHCDFGVNIAVGDDFHADCNCTMLDVGGIRIGDRCLIGPDVGLYTAGHSLVPEGRTLAGYGAAIEIGSDVWIGGHSTVLPGVTVGDGAVIAAGSVVNRDVPPRTLVAGNPARIVKRVDD